ncbi:hypothetical protein [Fusobacterium nucleatum]|uniref:Uncharacterized protein n=1 Tax=Fusobacterium nucleatum TaxID=851 RepID=A0A133NZI6_FUSNU|nr:hypothetical protein [Fusobacterium nucleatum]KXA21683.1 hypothetical protein HMPREF3221_01087 [Fusobacterium nucleatum]MCL4576697.1 hypothetical protein [Fusobacterium nucleatum YWH7056]MCL4583750.1 hypothetical protein [Fusobacterium nucleatum YWH7054]MCL4592473.1 hypothetical protein [Fusobacterium nucleatum YWH7053]
MKIISKFKDFYDYKVVKYEVDEKLVYNRKTYYDYYKILHINILTDENGRVSVEDFNKNLKENIKYFKHNNHNKVLIVGEKIVHLFFTENKVYTHFDIKNPKDIGGEKIYRYWAYYTDKKEITFKDGKKFNIYSRFREDWEYLLSYNREKLINLDIDKNDIILNEPMILIELIGISNHNRYLYTYKFTYNPYLSKLGIYIDEDFIWQSLVEFLSNKRSEKEIFPEISNENKILSKGFDLKTSFRPNMKKKK